MVSIYNMSFHDLPTELHAIIASYMTYESLCNITETSDTLDYAYSEEHAKQRSRLIKRAKDVMKHALSFDFVYTFRGAPLGTIQSIREFFEYPHDIFIETLPAIMYHIVIVTRNKRIFPTSLSTTSYRELFIYLFLTNVLNITLVNREPLVLRNTYKYLLYITSNYMNEMSCLSITINKLQKHPSRDPIVMKAFVEIWHRQLLKLRVPSGICYYLHQSKFDYELDSNDDLANNFGGMDVDEEEE